MRKGFHFIRYTWGRLFLWSLDPMTGALIAAILVGFLIGFATAEVWG